MTAWRPSQLLHIAVFQAAYAAHRLTESCPTVPSLHCPQYNSSKDADLDLVRCSSWRGTAPGRSSRGCRAAATAEAGGQAQQLEGCQLEGCPVGHSGSNGISGSGSEASSTGLPSHGSWLMHAAKVTLGIAVMVLCSISLTLPLCLSLLPHTVLQLPSCHGQPAVGLTCAAEALALLLGSCSTRCCCLRLSCSKLSRCASFPAQC